MQFLLKLFFLQLCSFFEENPTVLFFDIFL